MERINIENLLNEKEIKAEEMMRVFGGGSTLPVPDFWKPYDTVYGSSGNWRMSPDDPCFKKFPMVP